MFLLTFTLLAIVLVLFDQVKKNALGSSSCFWATGGVGLGVVTCWRICRARCCPAFLPDVYVYLPDNVVLAKIFGSHLINHLFSMAIHYLAYIV